MPSRLPPGFQGARVILIPKIAFHLQGADQASRTKHGISRGQGHPRLPAPQNGQLGDPQTDAESESESKSPLLGAHPRNITVASPTSSNQLHGSPYTLICIAPKDAAVPRSVYNPPHPFRMQGVFKLKFRLQVQLQGRFTSPYPYAGSRVTAALAKNGPPDHTRPPPFFGPFSDASQVAPLEPR